MKLSPRTIFSGLLAIFVIAMAFSFSSGSVQANDQSPTATQFSPEITPESTAELINPESTVEVEPRTSNWTGSPEDGRCEPVPREIPVMDDKTVVIGMEEFLVVRYGPNYLDISLREPFEFYNWVSTVEEYADREEKIPESIDYKKVNDPEFCEKLLWVTGVYLKLDGDIIEVVPGTASEDSAYFYYVGDRISISGEDLFMILHVDFVEEKVYLQDIAGDMGF